MAKKLNVVLLMPYANNHVLGWANHLKSWTNLQIVCRQSVSKYRKGYFEHLDSDPEILYLFKKNKNKKIYYEILKDTDIFISLGIFDPVFFQSIRRTPKSCNFYILSEPFNPLSSTKKLLLRKILSRIYRFYNQNINFLAIGGAAVKSYYLDLGFTESNFYNFGYFPKNNSSLVAPNNSKNGINFLFVGQFIQRKGIDKLLKCLDHLATVYKNENWTFTVVGEGPLKEDLLKTISCLKSSKIRYLGLIKDELKLMSIYKSADVLFIPSKFDGWGAVVNEAISCGLSIISSKTVYASKFLVEEKINGFTFDYENEKEMVQAIDNYFSSGNNIEIMKKESFRIFQEWNPYVAAKKIFDLIKGCEVADTVLLKKI